MAPVSALRKAAQIGSREIAPPEVRVGNSASMPKACSKLMRVPNKFVIQNAVRKHKLKYRVLECASPKLWPILDGNTDFSIQSGVQSGVESETPAYFELGLWILPITKQEQAPEFTNRHLHPQI